MKNKRALIITGSTIAIAVAALLIVPSFIDWSKYQSLAQTKVKEATGYDLAINGTFRMSILPAPHATIGDVAVSKPVGGQPQTFLTFDKADIRIALLPLLAGNVEIASVTLEKPEATLVTYKDGTDNYTPVKQPAQVDPVTGETVVQTTDASGDKQNISVNAFRIKDGHVVLRNEGTGKMQDIGIDDLHLKADTLSGPFDGDGSVRYNDATFDLSLNTGGYKEGESLPVQLNVKDKDGRGELKWSGVVATGAAKEAQGEMALSFDDLAGLLHDAGIEAAIPSLGDKVKISGMLTASENRVSFANGDVALGKAKFKTRLDATGLKSDAMSVTGVIETPDMINIDDWIKVADKVTKQQADGKKADDKDSKAKAAPAATARPLLPADFALPKAMKGDVQIRAAGLSYHDHATGPVEARLTAADGKGDLRLTVADLPGGGNLTASAGTAAPGIVEGNVLTSVSDLKQVASDWLGLVDAKTFDQPGMPQRIEADAGFRVQGYNATATINNLSLGEPKITGTLAYTAAVRPVLNAKLAANVWTLPAPAAATAQAADGKSDAKAEKAAPKKFEWDFNPPQLPFDAKFDLTVDRLVRGNLALSNVRAAGTYDGKGVTLTAGNATINGGTLSATGSVADLKDLSGIDLQAGLRTNDLETFYEAMTGTPLAIKQKVGDFAGSVKAVGDREKLGVDATLQALGYTITGTGTLNDPFAPEIPGTMAVRIKHPDLVQAIRAFSPGFGSNDAGGSKPIDIAGTAKIHGKVYSFDDMRAVLGSSDLAGSLKADLSGSVPAITANLASKNLDVGALVGVNSKTGARKAAAGNDAGITTTTSNNGGAGQWSREPLDTGFLKAMNADVKLTAGTLTYGTWTLTDAKAGVNLKDGTLAVTPLSGKMFGGSLDGKLDASSAGAGQPLNIDFKADVNSVNIGAFMQALTSSPAKRADGTGSVSLAFKGAGVSSAALMSSLNGSIDTKAKSLVIYGIDIDKLAANIVEAFDGGWKGALAGFTQAGFSNGQTQFKDFDQKFTIQNGDMPINNFRLETTNANAIVLTSGTVSFARWYMDLQSNVQVTQPKDVPVIGLRLVGPLNQPQKSVSSQALDNLVRGKLGNKVQDLLGDKLKDSPAGNLLNQFLGGGKTAPAAPAPTAPAPTAPAATTTPAAVAPSAAPADTVAPAATPDATTPAPAASETPAAAPAETAPAATSAEPAPAATEEKKDPRQQLLEGVLNQLSQ